VQAVSHKVNTLQGGVALSRNRCGAFPFHWADHLRATNPDRDRGIEQVHYDKTLDRLLFELGAPGC
jgi:hypothetical protein